LAQVESLLRANKLPVAGVADALSDFFVAEDLGTVVGVIGMEYRDAYGLLRSTAVDAAQRGKGIARQLVERIIAEARGREVDALYLLTTTADEYFTAFGFRTTTRDVVPDAIRATGEFQGACPASATVMSLSLRG